MGSRLVKVWRGGGGGDRPRGWRFGGGILKGGNFIF